MFFQTLVPNLLFDQWELANKLGIWIHLRLKLFPKMRSRFQSLLVAARCDLLQNDYFDIFQSFLLLTGSASAPLEGEGGCPLLLHGTMSTQYGS